MFLKVNYSSNINYRFYLLFTIIFWGHFNYHCGYINLDYKLKKKRSTKIICKYEKSYFDFPLLFSKKKKSHKFPSILYSCTYNLL